MFSLVKLSPPPAGWAAEPRWGPRKDAGKGGGGAEKHPSLRGGLTLGAPLSWPAGGALTSSLDQTSQPPRAARQALQFHATARGRGGGTAAPQPSPAIPLGLFTLLSKRTCVSLYLPTLPVAHTPSRHPLLICAYAAHTSVIPLPSLQAYMNATY